MCSQSDVVMSSQDADVYAERVRVMNRSESAKDVVLIKNLVKVLYIERCTSPVCQ